MDFVQTASTLFRDLGGLAKMIERLEWEIARGSEPLGSGTHPVLAKGPAGTIPYPRRNLIKFLMRAIGISSYTPGTTARPLVLFPAPLPSLDTAKYIEWTSVLVTS